MSLFQEHKDKNSIVLKNGLEIQYNHADTWSVTLYVKTPFEKGETGLFNVAANHLIEHCLVAGFSDCAETRSNMVKYDLAKISNSAEALDRFNLLASNLSKISLKNISLEKSHIFQEWAGCSEQTDKFKYWGSLISPVSADKWDIVDESITPEKGLSLINRQVDYMNSFEEEGLKKHALATYGAESMLLSASTPLSFEEFKKLIEQSNLSAIPRKHEGGELIPFRNVPEQTKYQNIGIDHLKLQISKKGKVDEDSYKTVFKTVEKSLIRDPDIALYWDDRKKDGDKETWSFKITSDKAALLRKKIFKTLATLTKDDRLGGISLDILTQMKGQLFEKGNKKSLSYPLPTKSSNVPKQPSSGALLPLTFKAASR